MASVSATDNKSTSAYLNYSCNIFNCSNSSQEYINFERNTRIIIPILFGLVAVTGSVGNLLVIIVIVVNKHMRSVMNSLIFSLAVADLCFIIFCVPFTAVGYATTIWPFGDAWCKIVEYIKHVCCYASSYTLVLMSLDRYFAVVFPLSSMSIRTQSNAIRAVAIIWTATLLANIPLICHTGEIQYTYINEQRTACVNEKIMENDTLSKAFFGSFFVFGYALPLSLMCVLYGLILRHMVHREVPSESNSNNSTTRSRKRVTRMVVTVVIVYALCWLPIQVIFMWHSFGHYPLTVLSISAQFVANVLAYMNSCFNPILYAFLSENFRRNFKKVLCCRRLNAPL